MLLVLLEDINVLSGKGARDIARFGGIREKYKMKNKEILREEKK